MTGRAAQQAARRAASSMRTQLVLDALEQAVLVCRREGANLAGLVHHTDAGSTHRSRSWNALQPLVFLRRSAPSGTPTTRSRRPCRALQDRVDQPATAWKTVEEVEIATLHYLDWFNNTRLYEENGDIPPVELEQAYYRQHRPSA
jgi:putative transposase